MDGPALSLVSNLFQKIVAEEAQLAFLKLLLTLSSDKRFSLLPVKHGNVTAIHISTSPTKRPYGDAEYAFSAAKDHLKWWFRSPAFENGLVEMNELSSSLSPLRRNKKGEATFDIFTLEDAGRVLECIQ